MALNICLEALIRLFFEIVRVLFGNITLIWKGGYLASELPSLLSTLKWVMIFAVVAMVSKNHLIRKLIIVGIPSLIGLLSYIPLIGNFLAIAAGIAAARVVVVSWVFVLWSDERIHPLLKFFATPGVMICAALNAVFPYTSTFGNLGYAFFMGYLPEIGAFLAIVFMGVSVIASPTSLCSALNWVLIQWEVIRYEGWTTALLSCFMFIRNKAFKIRC